MSVPEIELPTQVFTTGQELAMARHRRMAILAGSQEYSALNVTVRHAMLSDLNVLIDQLEQKLADEQGSSNGSGNVLARLNPGS